MIPSLAVMPLVSVGMPIYNDDRYAATAIEDILNQSYSNLEILISDNCSTDNTEAICRKYASSDKRVKYVRQRTNIGGQPNFEYLLRMSSGKYFMWAASDDRWDPEYISKLVTALDENDDAVIAFCPYDEIDERGVTLESNFRFDFGGGTALRRLIKFNMESSPRRDAFFYGLFKKDKVPRVRFVKWWWINRSIPMGSAYPILHYFLVSGNYCLVDSLRPLWFNRIHCRSSPRHSADFSDRRILSYFAFVLRKVNQFYETEAAIIRGSGSVLKSVPTIPVLGVRCLFDILKETTGLASGLVRKGWIRLKPHPMQTK